MTKNLKYTLTLTAATLTLLATAAYGEYNALTAKIPFAFRAVGSDLPAGQYKIAPAGSAGAMLLRNMDTGKGVFILSKGGQITESKDAQPRLVFQCGGEGCSLAKLWSGTGSGLEFPTPALKATQREHREASYVERTVYLAPSN